MFSKICKVISSGLKEFSDLSNTDSYEVVNNSLSKIRVQEALVVALKIATEKGWLTNENNKEIKQRIVLTQYKKSKKLVWRIHFYYFVTDEDWWNKNMKFNSIEFAIVTIDEETGDARGEEFDRLQFAQNW